MKTILNFVRNLLVGKPIPEKVLTLLCSDDQELIDLAFSMLDLDANRDFDNQSRKKKKQINRLQNVLWKRGYRMVTITDVASYPLKYSVRELSPAEKYNYR